MPQLQLNQFNARLKAGELSPLYLFYGEEQFLVNEALERLKPVALGEGLPDFNLDSYYCNEVDIPRLVDVIGTLPMMAKSRVVILKNAHELKTDQMGILLPVVENPVESTCFILIAKKMDQRKKFFKHFLEKGQCVKCDRPNDKDMPNWVKYIAKKHGKSISSEVADFIFQIVGNSLSDINNEMAKLVQYVGDKAEITKKDVVSAVSKLRVESVFELAKAIGEGDQAKSLYCLVNLLGHGENEVGILALISRHMRILSLVKESLKEGLNNYQIAKRVGVPPFYVHEYISQASKWSDFKLRHIHQALLLTDKALKSSPVSAHIWLENFIIKTCSI